MNVGQVIPVSAVQDASQSALLARKLRSVILDGRLPADDPLPSHRELANQYNVGVQVVRSALAVLEEEGLIISRERRGTFLRKAPPADRHDARAGALRCINFFERPTGTTPGFVRTGYLQGYTAALEHRDVRMRILPSLADDQRWERLLSPMFPWHEQGCVLINLLSPSLMRWLDEHEIPFVLQNNKAYSASALPPHHSVYINKFRGGFEATQHLIALGHRRIAFVGPCRMEDRQTQDVFGGYQAALAFCGLLIDEAVRLHLDIGDTAMAIDPIERFLEECDGITAVFTSNDSQAIAAMEAARRLGLRVPEDLSIVGYDDLPEAAQTTPTLTTVANPRTWLGRAAVELLFEIKAGKFTSSQTYALEGPLVVRESSAPANASLGA